jgi:hypothetical protein
MVISTAARNAMADALVGLFDAGSAAATVEIRTGSQPASPASGATGTLLATITLQDPAFGSAANGSAAVAGSPSSVGVAAGSAGWFRVKDSNGVAVEDGNCGASGSGADMELSNVSIAVDQTVTITSWTITVPAS